jgi:hypothetical protein
MQRRQSFGGVDGNEILTSSVAAVLTVLLVIEGVTILRIGPMLVPLRSGRGCRRALSGGPSRSVR